jgi:hypothetical protein
MLSTLNRDSGRASWRLRIVLVAGGLAVLALLGLYLSRAEVAQADPVVDAKPAQAAEPSDSAPQPQPTPAPATPNAKVIPEPSIEYFPEPTEVEKRINDALDKRATFEFVESPLIDVMVAMADKLDDEIEVQLDNRALEDAGISGDTPVTRTVKNLPIRTALRLLLNDLDLTYLIQDEVVLITTLDKADTQLVTRIYPVGDLVPEIPVAAPKATGAGKAKSGGGKGGGGMGGGMFAVADDDSPAARPPGAKDGQPAPADKPAAAEKSVPTTKRDFDTLIQAITWTIKPQTWDEVGGPGSILEVPVASSLVISATYDVHDEVLQLLRALRAAKRVSEAGAAH